jgi:hypothetical protein
LTGKEREKKTNHENGGEETADGLNLKRVEAFDLPCWDEANTKRLAYVLLLVGEGVSMKLSQDQEKLRPFEHVNFSKS